MRAMRETGKSVSQHMGTAEGILHWTMIICTVGLWYPVYRHRLNSLHRTTKFYA